MLPIVCATIQSYDDSVLWLPPIPILHGGSEVVRSPGPPSPKGQDGADGPAALGDLRAYAARMPWHSGEREEHFRIAARSFAARPDGDRVRSFDLADLDRLWRGSDSRGRPD